MSLEYAPNNPLRILIAAGFIAVFALMTMVTWLSMSTLHDVNNSMSELIESTSQKASRAYRMRDVIRLRSNSARTLIHSQDPEDRHAIFDKLIEYTNDYRDARTQLDALDANEREQIILDQIDKTYTRVNTTIEDTNEYIYATNQDNDVLDVLLSELELQELVLLNHLNKLVTLEKSLAEESLEENQTTYDETRQLLFLMVIVSFALSMAISGIVIWRVTRDNKRISHLANHDDLTGLHNRRSFEQHLQHTIDIAERSPSAHALLYIDLDRFKMVNDTCGHQAGDLLLIELTQLINGRLRRGDLFARLGGDEFAIIAQGETFDKIRTLAEELRQLVCDFIFHYETQSFNVSLSVGLTLVDGQVQSVEQVLADVDAACYVAKQSGRNRVHVKQDNDADLVQYRNNLAGVQAIREALNDERLALFYQPIYKVGSNLSDIEHCEILLKIQSETGELYSPVSAISIAEKYNIMNEIDRWVFTQVIDWLVIAKKDRITPSLLINLSGHSFADEQFIKFVMSRLEETDIDPSCITFEISEASIVSNFEQLKVFLNSVRNLGCKVALDDFGSGYSNFANLKSLSFDYVKINGSMVQKIAENSVDKNMVSAINQLGHTVGAKTIAEFVGDDETMRCLEELEVDFAQGDGLKMPTPLDQLVTDLPMLYGYTDSESTTNDAANQNFDDSTQGKPFRRAS
ncbi:EAL domain-containing protein [Granulosicoccus sp.]|nr:EAL domain-containing protein [Granulosicoccus sp.]MDB4222377.1 EAL domain-containing protein [Granulosicoccus sp.]